MVSQEQITEAVLAFLNAKTWPERKGLVETHQALLFTAWDAVEEVFELLLAQYRNDEQVIRLVKQGWQILARCRRDGIEAAFAELIKSATMEALHELISCETWHERKRVVETHHALLLTGEVEELFEAWLAEYQDNAEVGFVINYHREILSHCRQMGIEAAFAELGRVALNVALTKIERLTGAHEMARRIQACQEALTLVDRTAQPLLWARLQHELADSAAVAQTPNLFGNRADNLELAFDHYWQALQVYTRHATPNEWAGIQNNLGNIYLDRIREQRATNVEQAIHHYEQALHVYTRHAFAEDWAMTHNNLSTAYRERIRGQRSENLEEAIFHCRQALQVYTRRAFPSDWAMTLNNLASAYRERIRGERAQNIEQAISLFQQALEVYTRQGFPTRWADIQSNLGEAYRERIRGARTANFERAITHYKQALQLYREQGFLEYAARSQQNQGNAYLERQDGQPAENIEQAIRHYEQALQVYSEPNFPSAWARTQHNLGSAYVYRSRGEPAANIEQAIEHYLAALRVRTRHALPERWAQTINNLAYAYGKRMIGLRAENVQQAIEHYWQALEVRTAQTLPLDCRQTAYWLGHLLYNEQRLASARQAFEITHQAIEALWREAPRSGAKERLAKENADLYARLVHTCLHLGDEVAAFEYAVAGKGRAFVDTLASGGFSIFKAIETNPALANDKDWHEYRALTEEVDYVRIALNSKKLSPEVKQMSREALQNGQKGLAIFWEDLTFKYPNLTATQQAPRLTADQAMTLAADLHATLVEYVEHAGGWSAFVVTQDAIQHLPLEKVDDKLLKGGPKWIKNLESKKATFFRPRITGKQLTQLYTALIAPLQKHLPPASQAERLVIAPFGALHQLPLNAAQNPDTLAYLSQAYTLTFTPSLAALRASLDRAKQANCSFRPPENAIHIAHAGHKEMTSLDSLQKADQSAAEMAEIFPNLQQLSEENATLQAAVTDVANRELIHFYCHGIFEPDNPNQSGLLLHDGFLTVQRIITDLDLSHTHLTALAACRSGRVGLKEGEELVGLIQALLIAGSKSVVATLWKVDEPPTQAFFQHFYRAIKAGHAPAEALSHATQAIRQTEGWEHPYYWAAFQISGLAHHMPK